MFDNDDVDDDATLALLDYVAATKKQGVGANQAALAAYEIIRAIYAGKYDPDPPSVSVTH